METEIAIKIQGLCKRYRRGSLGAGTLNASLQSKLARLRGREDPNRALGGPEGEFFALRDVDLTIRRGETVGIIGGNGAGKSTLLKILSRVTAPTAGTVDLYGRVASMLEVGTGFHGEMTGRENVYLNGAILGMSREEIARKLPEIVAFSGIDDVLDTPVKRYSSGMYVKLAFAVAAHLDSEILIMDEVLAVGDAAFRKKCLDRMADAARSGRTVLYVSHNMSTVRRLCSRCILLSGGRVVYDGDVDTAIEGYLGMGGAAVRVDCDALPREPICQGGARILETVILKDSPVIERGEKLEFALGYRAEGCKNLRVRLVIFAGGSPVGMATVGQTLPDGPGEHRIRLAFSLDDLAPGTYRGRLALYQVDEFGGEKILDVADPALAFRVQDPNPDETTQVWKDGVWGHIHFPEGAAYAD